MSVDPRPLASALRGVAFSQRERFIRDNAANLVEQVVVPLHDAWLKAKPPCPTCGGSVHAPTCWSLVRSHMQCDCDGCLKCPDCSDGVLPFDKWTAGLVALWTAVWDGVSLEAPWGHDDVWLNAVSATLEHLREVSRQIGDAR